MRSIFALAPSFWARAKTQVAWKKPRALAVDDKYHGLKPLFTTLKQMRHFLVRAASIVDFFLLADLGFRNQYYTKGWPRYSHIRLGYRVQLTLSFAYALFPGRREGYKDSLP